LAPRAAASAPEIRTWNPTEATASKTTPKITLRISSSYGLSIAVEYGTLLFQGFFVRPKNGFIQRAVMRT
jgi:hypothetical protein